MKVAVIGGGTMGNGIAHVCAQNGHDVNLIDLNPDVLVSARDTITKNLDRMVKKDIITEDQKAETLSRINGGVDMPTLVSDRDIVIEAVVENEQVKQTIFKELDQHCPPHCILASNTSSISITRIARATSRPDKVIGMHFMNPVPVMKLVEVIKGYSTSDETLETVMEMSRGLGKIPLSSNDYPGFVANRILMPMINEAITALWQGVAGVEEIDGIMRLGMAHPMGPLFLADFIGLDVCLHIMYVLQSGLGSDKYAPCPLLVNMVSAGKLGRKTGEGFYIYGPGSKDVKVSPAFQQSVV